VSDDPAPLTPPDRHIDFLLGADGQVSSASPDALRWLEQPGALERVRGLAKGGEARTTAWWMADAPLHFRFVPMHGAEQVHTLVTVVPPRAELSEALELLSPTQREVAEYAAAGATVAEIADVLERSPETVRSHIKEVYKRLSICTRLELQWLLRRPAISYE